MSATLALAQNPLNIVTLSLMRCSSCSRMMTLFFSSLLGPGQSRAGRENLKFILSGIRKTTHGYLGWRESALVNSKVGISADESTQSLSKFGVIFSFCTMSQKKKRKEKKFNTKVEKEKIRVFFFYLSLRTSWDCFFFKSSFVLWRGLCIARADRRGCCDIKARELLAGLALSLPLRSSFNFSLACGWITWLTPAKAKIKKNRKSLCAQLKCVQIYKNLRRLRVQSLPVMICKLKLDKSWSPAACRTGLGIWTAVRFGRYGMRNKKEIASTQNN